MNRNVNLNKLVKIAILSAIAFVVMFLETPPVFSSFLKFDFSDIVAVIGGFALGPIAGVVIQLIKNLLHLPLSQTSGVGELANFIVGSAFVYPAALVYAKQKNKKGAIMGLITGVISMVVIGVLANYFILLPFYAAMMGFTMEMVVDATNFMNPLVTNKLTFLIFAIAPFNLIKGSIVSVVTLLVYKRVSGFLNKQK
ncbi:MULTISPECIES: ECF transporter S component [unclassified Fusibacter]|uniref:ECF transporter S component n=1 Tax=unclassified Fusibacter TaxID=2624464 RepID=UPI001013B411|nr:MULTISPECIES: ECF transporter S component [unclassified Fusibacter]MCK8059462.1 ECF transporter S component [Fusibacter sp. A2]NPE21074.1 ECF transporter S component [Fusibacter sp. A1]RXV62348.1 ECF transporter S component [Fusibacter sp. A1]